MSNPKPLFPGEVDGIISYVINTAKHKNDRQLFIPHEDLYPYLIGEKHPNKIKGNEADINEHKQKLNNRIRHKMAIPLASKGISVQYNSDGYVFVIDDSIPISEPKKDVIENEGFDQEIEMQSTYTDFNSTFYPPHNFPNLITAIKNGMNCLLVGPKGSGKSRSFEEVGAVLGLEQIRIAMGSVHDPADLIGTKELVQENGATITKFIPGLLTSALMEGKMVILDEIDSVQPQVTLALNMVLEHQADITCLTESGPVKMKRNPKSRICATSNTWGYGDGGIKYVGTEIVNSATMDRFDWKDEMDYDERIERRIASCYLRPSIVDMLYREKNEKYKSNNEGVILSIRQAIKKDEIIGDLSIRAIENFARSYKDFGWHKGMVYFILNNFAPDYREKIKQIVRLSCGNNFVPSVNDFDENKIDYIPEMLRQIRETTPDF